MTKEVLIITSYYPPETGAAANRIYNLANGLSRERFKVSVVTPVPNYPNGKVFRSYRNKFKVVKTEKEVKVYRLWVYASNSKNIFKRLWGMLSYGFSLLIFFAFNKIPERVIVQSPPLLVACICMLFLKSRKRKLILNVSDLWPLAGLELGAFKKNVVYKVLQKIEKFNYCRANVIMGQSEEIISHVRKICPEKQFILYRNFPKGIDSVPLNFTPTEGKLKIVYAGLLGHAQGIHKLLQNLNLTNLEFHIYGAGAEQKHIEDFIINNPNSGVHYHGVLSRQEVLIEIQKYHLVIIPLLNRIYGSVPSKIFEFSALGMPLLYFGGGEGESIVEKFDLGWVVEAGNYNKLNEQMSKINHEGFDNEMRAKIKNVAQSEFRLDKQLKALTEILN